MFLCVLLVGILCLSAIIGDNLVLKTENKIVKACIDNGTHALIGGLSWSLVLLFRKKMILSGETIWQIVLCTLLSSLIDIDHFVAAQSLKLQDVHLLTDRPFLHCTTVTIGISIFLVVSSHLSWEFLHTLGWIFFAASVSHHTRDAERRGFWIFPIGSTPPLDRWLYISAIATLPYITMLLFNFTKPVQLMRNLTSAEEFVSLV